MTYLPDLLQVPVLTPALAQSTPFVNTNYPLQKLWVGGGLLSNYNHKSVGVFQTFWRKNMSQCLSQQHCCL